MIQRAIKAIFWVLLRFIYRVRTQGLHNIPKGAAVLTPNHVTTIDAVLIAAHIGRPIHFAMYWRIYNNISWLVAPMGAFPIASPKENLTVYNAAFQRMADALARGELVCLFPEGMLTLDGNLNDFKGGISKLLKASPAPVVPVGLRNLWGSYFSRKKKGVFKLPDHFMAKIEMVVGEPLPATTSPLELREKVATLL